MVGGARLSTSTALAVTATRCAFLGFIAATLGAAPTNEEVRVDISESRLKYASVWACRLTAVRRTCARECLRAPAGADNIANESRKSS